VSFAPTVTNSDALRHGPASGRVRVLTDRGPIARHRRSGGRRGRIAVRPPVYVEVSETSALHATSSSESGAGTPPAASAASSRSSGSAAGSAWVRRSENSSTSHAEPSGASAGRGGDGREAPVVQQRPLARVGALVGRLDREAAAALHDL
jgi:hypothetical protein